jgi:hypothetical protein
LPISRIDRFGGSSLERVVLPWGVREIDPDAFPSDVWLLFIFDGPPPYLINNGFVYASDSRVLLRYIVEVTIDMTIAIRPHIEVIGHNAFSESLLSGVSFESGSQLREIRSRSVHLLSASEIIDYSIIR